MKGTEVSNLRRSSACDCTCVLTRIETRCIVSAVFNHIHLIPKGIANYDQYLFVLCHHIYLIPKGIANYDQYLFV